MAFHHIALATRDLAATHRFYTELMGFSLAKVVVGPVPGSPNGGWSRHVFYDTGASGPRDTGASGPRDTGASGGPGSPGMVAFWEINDEQFADYPTNLNQMAGLPGWANHFAYDAPTREFLDERRAVWCAAGLTVPEVDHEFCVSIYTTDPDGNTVEFCHTVREFTDDEVRESHELLTADHPPMDKDPRITIWPPTAAMATQ